ncbi:MAG: IS110 family transposase [Sediminibacterium sp.]|jgi:transposase|uniref:IS110 family transposase n=1 Tax=Bacteroidota TaxID=976 RepID=UPI0027213B07|nr:MULTISPECIES: IS110 family transposase [Bacteroidota]MDO8996112.1 IS110 family transposase [Sediminibacterium sp.]MDP2412293.1 IS110 family transposase [Daejeonella sp.]
MEFNFFIGTDVSKNELDFAIMQNKTFLFHKKVSNTPAAITTLLNELVKLPGFKLSMAVFCMEHTGIYSNHLLGVLFKKQCSVCLEAALHIRNSLGNIRGKSDKIDAIRIAEYAYKNREQLRLWQPKREVVIRLAQLSATRSRLIEAQKVLTTPIKESREFIPKGLVKENTTVCQSTLIAIKKDLTKVDKAIQGIIASDLELRRLFALITSVDGIGKATATQIIISTNEFKTINNPTKFACYAGVVPFSKESGLFKGRARVSHLANKKMKTLLHLAALSAIRYNNDMEAYYGRKVTQENKNKMSTLNAVRNKLIHRIFACVNNNRPYEKNYQRLVA